MTIAVHSITAKPGPVALLPLISNQTINASGQEATILEAVVDVRSVWQQAYGGIFPQAEDIIASCFNPFLVLMASNLAGPSVDVRLDSIQGSYKNATPDAAADWATLQTFGATELQITADVSYGKALNLFGPARYIRALWTNNGTLDVSNNFKVSAYLAFPMTHYFMG